MICKGEISKNVQCHACVEGGLPNRLVFVCLQGDNGNDSCGHGQQFTPTAKECHQEPTKVSVDLKLTVVRGRGSSSKMPPSRA